MQTPTAAGCARNATGGVGVHGRAIGNLHRCAAGDRCSGPFKDEHKLHFGQPDYRAGGLFGRGGPSSTGGDQED